VSPNSRNDYNINMSMYLIVSWIGFFAALLVVIPFAAMKDRRQPPLVLQTLLLADLMIFSIPGIMATFDEQHLVCVNDYTAASKSHASCVASAVIFHASAIMAVWLCFWLMFDAMLSVWWPEKKNLAERVFPWQMGISVVYTLIMVIIASAAQVYGYDNGVSCAILDSNSNSIFEGYNMWIEAWALLPIAIAAAVLWIMTFVQLLRHIDFNFRNIVFAVRVQLRLMIFVFYYVFAVLQGLLIGYIYQSKTSVFTDSITTWLTCSWSSASFWTFHIGQPGPNNSTVPIFCGAEAVQHPVYGWVMFENFLEYFSPIFFAVCLGTVPDVYNFYKQLFTMIFTCNYSFSALQSLTERSSTTVANPSVSLASARPAGSSFAFTTSSAALPGDEEF